MFFNTINVRGYKLTAYQIKATKQESQIYEFFHHNPGMEVTPEDIMKWHPEFTWTPITSIRRAFTNLATDGRIEKTDHQIDGMYGMPIHTWRLKQCIAA
jgi:hypothetical protein